MDEIDVLKAWHRSIKNLDWSMFKSQMSPVSGPINSATAAWSDLQDFSRGHRFERTGVESGCGHFPLYAFSIILPGFGELSSFRLRTPLQDQQRLASSS